MRFIKEKVWWVVGLAGVYLVVAGASWAGFSYLLAAPGAPVPTVPAGGVDEARGKIDTSGPKTEVCPLNGALFTKAERAIWEPRRPMAVMIENHADSRPPSGLSRADVVYEAVAEGGITRFMAVYYCGAAAGDVKIAPIRSTRIYYINFAAEYGDRPLYVHVGGANDFQNTGDTDRKARALEELAKLGWRVRGGNDIDTTLDAGFPEMWRNLERLDHPVATEHTYMGSTDRLWQEAEKRGLSAMAADGKKWDVNFMPWKFDDPSLEAGMPIDGKEAASISFYFWKGQFQEDYAVKWEYDGASGRYLRFNGVKPHMDLDVDRKKEEQLVASNVVVMFAKEKGPVDRNKHILYENTGSGEALVFRNGKVIEARWRKESQRGRTRFFVKKGGAEVSFAPGVVWVEMLPVGNPVEY